MAQRGDYVTAISKESLRSSWLLVETLQPGLPTVVGVGDRARGMSSLARAVKDQLGGRTAAHLLADITRLVAETAAWTRPQDEIFATPIHRTRIITRPLVSCDGVVHAVHIWIGDADVPHPPPPPDSIATTFLPDQRLFETDGRELAAMLNETSAITRATYTLPEAFRYYDVDDAMAAVTTLIDSNPEAGDTWHGMMTIKCANGFRRVHAVFVAVNTPGPTRWRGLVHAVHDDAVARPSLETAAVAALRTVAPQTVLALMDVTHSRVIRWLTDPVPGIMWKGTVDNRDTPHPDDVARIFAASAEIFFGRATHTEVDNVRLRRAAGGWTIVNFATALLTNSGNGPRLALTQMTVVGTSSDPDPVSPDDPGHPSLLAS